MSRRLLFMIFLLLAFALNASATNDKEEFSLPFDFPVLFSGNFAELRSNHFHGGLDFKTQGVTGKPIHAPADGYVSRVTVTPGGYGNALYLTHYNGYTTVYGHLDSFTPDIEACVRRRQYSDETFAVDLSFKQDEYPVQRGDVIAMSGNTGYSFGPHLHFEVRETESNELVNPLRFYKKHVKDSKPPKAYAVTLYPRPGRGVVNGDNKKCTRRIVDNSIKDTITAWGEVGFAVKALDFMDNTSNNYGVYHMELHADDSLLFSCTMDRVAFSENRLINAWVDYEAHYQHGEWYMRSHLLDNNPLRMLSADANNGWLRVDEERIYEIRYLLADMHGNVSSYAFVIKGEPSDISAVNSAASQYLCWDIDNEIRDLGMRLKIPAGELFEDAMLRVEREEMPDALSDRYSFNASTQPLWHGCELSIQFKNMPPQELLAKCYIRRVRGGGGYGVGGSYSDGRMVAKITNLGSYEIAMDTIPPTVKPVNEKQWKRDGRLSFYIGDSETGVSSYKGYVDGEFRLFKFSSKNARLSCDLKSEGVASGTNSLRLVVVDGAGNETVIEKSFKY